MAQLSGDSFEAGQALLPLDEAVRLLFERIPPVSGIEHVPLAEADGRVLASPLVAALDLPPFDNSAVDGYAVRFADLATGAETVLPLLGRIAAGHAPEALRSAGPHAIRIFTGAPLPTGVDTVFMQEDCKRDAEGRVVLPTGLAKGANARPCGEDVARGSVPLAEGCRLTPDRVALAAALGLASLPVRRRLRVAIFSTGDEIVEPGAPARLASVYDSNRFFLLALLKRLGVVVTDLGILPDKEPAILRALSEAAASHDLLLTSGGVSAGEEDHVKTAVSGAGSLVFWRVAIKPGRSVALGVIAGTPFLGLPGNPVAVFITFAAIARPILAALSGETWTAPAPMPVIARFPYRKKSGRREYVRVTLKPEAGGRFGAHPHPVEGTGVLTSLTGTDGLVELAEETLSVEPGDQVGFIAYTSLR